MMITTAELPDSRTERSKALLGGYAHDAQVVIPR